MTDEGISEIVKMCEDFVALREEDSERMLGVTTTKQFERELAYFQNMYRLTKDGEYDGNLINAAQTAIPALIELARRMKYERDKMIELRDFTLSCL